MDTDAMARRMAFGDKDEQSVYEGVVVASWELFDKKRREYLMELEKLESDFVRERIKDDNHLQTTDEIRSDFKKMIAVFVANWKNGHKVLID